MIHWIFYEWLYNSYEGGGSYLVKALNVFNYVTFRTAYASVTALLISLIFGKRVIQALKNWNVGQQIRSDLDLAVGETIEPLRLDRDDRVPAFRSHRLSG
jgi:hypothetical protein